MLNLEAVAGGPLNDLRAIAHAADEARSVAGGDGLKSRVLLYCKRVIDVLGHRLAVCLVEAGGGAQEGRQ